MSACSFFLSFFSIGENFLFWSLSALCNVVGVFFPKQEFKGGNNFELLFFTNIIHLSQGALWILNLWVFLSCSLTKKDEVICLEYSECFWVGVKAKDFLNFR